MSLSSDAIANASRGNGPANRLARVSDGQSIMERWQVIAQGLAEVHSDRLIVARSLIVMRTYSGGLCRCGRRRTRASSPDNHLE